MPDLTLEVLERLISFDTTSRNSNLPMVAWIEDFLADHGVTCERLPSPDGWKANLLARVGPAEPGGIVLCGHTDTVPVEGQPWTTDPFSLDRRGERLYGRGVVDMKGFLACVLAAVPRALRTELVRPLWIALTYDEEVGCLGAGALAARLAAEPCAPAMVVVGEPTGMRLVRGHKGIRVLRSRVTGRDAHSSQPDAGANAIVAAARLVGFVDELARERRAQGPTAVEFSPPHTTFNAGTITGGQALNIVARDCELVWEYRCVPGDDPQEPLDRVEAFVREQVLPELRVRADEAEINTAIVADVPVLDPATNTAVAAQIMAATGVEGGPPAAFGTDGSTFAAAGVPTVVLGPGATDQMHTANESITVPELQQCTRFIEELLESDLL